MKKIFLPIIDYLHSFALGKNRVLPIKINPHQNIQKIIQTALHKRAAVHVIYSDKNFTGDIVRYSSQKKQLILKNFKRSVTVIIPLEEIKKISILPDSIKRSQHLD